MEFTLVQEGLTPLTEELMWDLVTSLDVFFAECSGEGAIRFDEIVEALQDVFVSWAEYPRIPTHLEIMAACCSLERRGVIETRFIGGILHFTPVPCV
jgi:hypothetical protein